MWPPGRVTRPSWGVAFANSFSSVSTAQVARSEHLQMARTVGCSVRRLTRESERWRVLASPQASTADTSTTGALRASCPRGVVSSHTSALSRRRPIQAGCRANHRVPPPQGQKGWVWIRSNPGRRQARQLRGASGSGLHLHLLASRRNLLSRINRLHQAGARSSHPHHPLTHLPHPHLREHEHTDSAPATHVHRAQAELIAPLYARTSQGEP